MALDPRIALAGRGTDVMSALSSGLASGEQIRTMGVRDAILNQQSQIQQQSIQQTQQEQALKSMQTFGSAIQGAMGIPDLAQRAKVFSQQIPSLVAMGVPEAQLRSIDLSDQGLKALNAQLQPFMARKQQEQQSLTGVGDISLKDFTAESVQKFMNSGQQDFSVLERLEKWTNVTLPDGSRAQISSTTGEIRYPKVDGGTETPTTEQPTEEQPIITGEGGVPPLATPQVPQSTTLTPAEQQRLKAESEALKTTAVETARQEVEAKDPAKVEQERKGNQMTKNAISSLNTIMSSDRLDDITGMKGGFWTFKPQTKDLLNTATQLSSILTAENLDIMSGVLSESDMLVIRGISNDLGFEFDDDGNVSAFSGSYAGTVKKMRNLRDAMISGLNNKGIFIDGQTANDPSGKLVTYKDGDWRYNDGTAYIPQ